MVWPARPHSNKTIDGVADGNENPPSPTKSSVLELPAHAPALQVLRNNAAWFSRARAIHLGLFKDCVT
jgi:hypothetical protein